MTVQLVTERPDIYVSEADHALLSSLVGSAPGGQAGPALLREELDRAVVVRAGDMPPGLVGLGSTVRYLDTLSGRERTVTLVLPAEADIERNRISVFTPIGAALLGLRAGQAILGPGSYGQERELQVLEVMGEPVATVSA